MKSEHSAALEQQREKTRVLKQAMTQELLPGKPRLIQQLCLFPTQSISVRLKMAKA